MIIELIQIISEYLSLTDQIKICNLNKNSYETIQIYQLYDMSEINDKILKQNKFQVGPALRGFAKIKNINHLVNLIELNYKYSGVDVDDIKGFVKLKILDSYYLS